MRERAIGYLLIGAAVWTVVVTLVGPDPARADEPSAAPTTSVTPTVSPLPSPEGSPSVDPPEPTSTQTLPGGPVPDVTTLPSSTSLTMATASRARVAQAGPAVSVAAVDDAFHPTPLTISVGTTVVWTNEGQNPHTVTANDRAFDSSTLMPDQRFSVTFDEVGEVPYYCQIHGEPGSGMVGLVVVRPAPAGEGDEGSPAPEPGGLPATGSGAIPIVIAAFLSGLAGVATLLAGRRHTGRR